MSKLIWFSVFLLVVLISQTDKVESSYAGSASAIINPSKVKQISWNPRAFVYQGFLTDLECDHLISLAKPKLMSSADADNLYDTAIHAMCKDFVYKGLLTDLECDHVISLAKSELKRSAVADNLSGDAQLTDVRTSTGTGTFISKNNDPIVSGIEDKISAWTFLPKENGEDIQVLRYEQGQKYDAHYDYFTDKVNIVQGGHRFATVLMYLTNVTKGGETVFPNAEEPPRRKGSEKSSDLSECAKKGIAVKPRRGDALLFFSLDTHATPDTNSLHGGCPVIEGEKWSATKWIHVDSFDKKVGDGGGCSDQHDSYERWATLGECTNNTVYIVGSSDLPGYCRRDGKLIIPRGYP